MSSIEKTLQERQKTHGSFSTHAAISQLLTGAMRSREGWERLEDDQKEALEMIAHKIARILNGNPNVHDHWHDISGYATLVAEQCVEKEHE